MTIDVVPVPDEFRDVVAGTAVVVIDVFRASTTITTALASGARFVIPAADVEQAVRLFEPHGRAEAVLAGERECQKIEGFHLGNSPREYTKETVGGKAVVFTTTNGTPALLAARDADLVLVGCFLNCAAVVQAVAARDHVILLCAGNAGELSLEDHICAGLYVSRLAGPDTELNDAALAARAAYRSVEPDLGRFLLSSAHARRLTRLGFGPDLALALRIDTLPLAAVFRAGRIEVPAP